MYSSSVSMPIQYSSSVEIPGLGKDRPRIYARRWMCF
uniref:Uncharacterized protein n=2 Tax=Setaria italica TaxID=4555 RepID=K3YF59_SETIT